MRLGFIGTGTITQAIVTGLVKAKADIAEIWLSPRNQATSRALADEFPAVRVGVTNQAVIDRTDMVILAVRPQIAPAVLTEIHFRADQQVVSLIATFSHQILAPLIAPATHLVRAAPLPGVAAGIGPTAIYPSDAATAGLFSQISAVVAVTQAAEFDALCACTAEMGSYFALLNICHDWLVGQGVPPDVARRYVASMFAALGHTATTTDPISFQQLCLDHMTKGGLNEQLHGDLTRDGVFLAHAGGLDRILARIRGQKAARSD